MIKQLFFCNLNQTKLENNLRHVKCESDLSCTVTKSSCRDLSGSPPEGQFSKTHYQHSLTWRKIRLVLHQLFGHLFVETNRKKENMACQSDWTGSIHHTPAKPRRKDRKDKLLTHCCAAAAHVWWPLWRQRQNSSLVLLVLCLGFTTVLMN